MHLAKIQILKIQIFLRIKAVEFFKKSYKIRLDVANSESFYRAF